MGVRPCGDPHFTESVYDQKTAQASVRLKTKVWNPKKRQSNVDGLAGTMERLAAFKAESDAGDSEAGVSTTTRLTSRLLRVLIAAGRLAEETARTGGLQSFRLTPHRARDFFGSMSRIKTRSPASWAATARQAASVLLA